MFSIGDPNFLRKSRIVVKNYISKTIALFECTEIKPVIKPYRIYTYKV